MSAGGSAPVEVFISYSHEDEALREMLGKHLSMLRNDGVIDEWHDRRIGAGHEWADAIDEHLNSAAVILLLVSADFLASDYCYRVEMKRALARHDAGEARVIPVILRWVDWQGALFAKLQALPRDGKPVTSWTNPDEAFTDVAHGIRQVVEEFRARKVVEEVRARP
ncbi:MAG: toll/interleukin-1 receptor domain-containing protein [Geminicoccaceae bacterium]